MNSMRSSTWGLQYALTNRGQIGALSDQQQLDLHSSLEPAYHLLDLAQASVNDMNRAGLEQTEAVRFQQEIDSERGRLDTLTARIPQLTNDADMAGWQHDAAEAFRSTSDLEARVRGTQATMGTSRLWTIGLWTGAGVLGAIGSVFLVRYMGKTRFFKRLFRSRR